MRRPAAVLALAAAAVALLGGAGTYALWSHTASGGAGTITAGDLDAVAIGALTWSTADDADEPDVLGSGERAWAVQGFDLALEGHNLVADATVDITFSAELDYPYQWFVSTDHSITDPHAALADGVPGLVLDASTATQGTLPGLTGSDLPDSLDGAADWSVYVLVENPHPPTPGDPSDLDLVTVRVDLTLEQTS